MIMSLSQWRCKMLSNLTGVLEEIDSFDGELIADE